MVGSVSPSPWIWASLWLFWPKEYSRSDTMWILELIYKMSGSFCLVLLECSLSWTFLWIILLRNQPPWCENPKSYREAKPRCSRLQSRIAAESGLCVIPGQPAHLWVKMPPDDSRHSSWVTSSSLARWGPNIMEQRQVTPWSPVWIPDTQTLCAS